jgi:hypothetical protein
MGKSLQEARQIFLMSLNTFVSVQGSSENRIELTLYKPIVFPTIKVPQSIRFQSKNYQIHLNLLK